MTSWHFPFETIFGKNAPISASFGSILILLINPSGMRISRYSLMRPAISSTESTSSAISIRRMLAKPLIRTGIFEPLGFSNSSAGPPLFTDRSANSVISSFGSTSNEIRLSSLFFSSAWMKSRRSS